jgi:hypothetical protein
MRRARPVTPTRTPEIIKETIEDGLGVPVCDAPKKQRPNSAPWETEV